MYGGGSFHTEQGLRGAGEGQPEAGHHGADAEQRQVSYAGPERWERGKQHQHYRRAARESVNDADGEGLDPEKGLAEVEEPVGALHRGVFVLCMRPVNMDVRVLLLGMFVHVQAAALQVVQDSDCR